MNTRPYAHQKINEDKFIYPITGLTLRKNEKIKIGSVTFISKHNLYTNYLDNELTQILALKEMYINTKTFAVVDLRKMGIISGICKDGQNSLALQALKQSIGAIYVAIYNAKERPDNERRIVISDLGIHEVDEGLNSYLAWHAGQYKICQNEVKHYLSAKIEDFDLRSVTRLTELLSKPYEYRSEYESKICKALEILYSTLNESYTRERILKLSIILNFAFRDNSDEKLDITHIGGKLKTIFNVIQPSYILESIPSDIVVGGKTSKISAIVNDIYKRIRNDIMHGRVDLQIEYAVCNLEDYIYLKVIVIELIKFMSSSLVSKKIKSTELFNTWIDMEQANYIKLKQQERYKNK